MDGEIIVRKVTDQDIDNLVDLYQEIWPEVHENKKEKNDFVLRESDGVNYCAERDGKLVGSRTSFYMPAYYGNRKLKCVQFANSCVHSSCRRKGLFLRLNQAFLDDFFGEKGGELVYNISVDASRAAYEKLGWVYIQSLTCIKKYLRPFHILQKTGLNIKKLHGNVKPDLDTETFLLDKQLLDARESMIADKLRIKYDEETFAWRIKSKNGMKMLKVDGLGCAIYKTGYKNCGVKVLTLGEIFLYDYTLDNLKKMNKALFKKEKPDIFLAYLTLSHPLHNMYEKLGFSVSKGFMNHGVKVMSDEMREIALRPENWALSFLDIDTF